MPWSIVGVAGELPAPEPGVLGVSGYNLVETKGDLFVHRHVDYEIHLNPDGSGVGIITVTLRNEAPRAGRLPYCIARTSTASTTRATTPPCCRSTAAPACMWTARSAATGTFRCGVTRSWATRS